MSSRPGSHLPVTLVSRWARTFAAGRAHEVIVYVEVENFNERRFDSARRRFNVVPVGASERANGRPVDFVGDRSDGGGVARRRGGEARLDDIDIERLKRARDDQFGVRRH